MKEYNDAVISRAMRDGYLISKFSGLRLWLPAINSTDEFTQAKEWRVACNFVIQSGNFLMLRAIHKMQQWIEENGLQDDVKIVLTVHDSVYLTVREDAYLISVVNKALIDFMAEPYESGQILDLEAELDIGRNFKDLITLPNNIDKEAVQVELDKI